MNITPAKCRKVEEVVRGRAIRKVQIFGSRARGEAGRQSDYDLLIHFDPDYTPSLFELGDLHHTLTKALDAEVDVIPYRTSLPPAILRDAKTIFERN